MDGDDYDLAARRERQRRAFFAEGDYGWITTDEVMEMNDWSVEDLQREINEGRIAKPELIPHSLEAGWRSARQ